MKPSATTRRLAGLLFLVLPLAFASCSDDGDDDSSAASSTAVAESTAAPSSSAAPTTAPAPATTTAPTTTDAPVVTTTPPVVQDVSDSPRTTDYVGARDEVTELTCVQDGDVWKVSGTVTNPTDEPADYRIFIAYLDGANETRGLLQTDIADVAPGAAEEWSGELELDADDLTCGLRVERTGVDGAPPPSEPAPPTS